MALAHRSPYMKRIVLIAAVLAGLIFLVMLMRGRAPVAEGERNRKFTQDMQSVTLVGQSTRDNRPGLFGPERYYIDSVTHLSGDTWLFRTRLEYHGKDIPVPIPLKVQWAGDTPVITFDRRFNPWR